MSTALTELQYRRWARDTRSPWAATGPTIGVEQLVELAETEIGDYLSTFLLPTQVIAEQHRPLVWDVDRLASFTRYYRVVLNRKRVLENRGFSVTWICTESEATDTIGVSVLSALQSKLDLSNCPNRSTDIVRLQIGYWAGLETLPIQLQRGVSLLARHDAQELILGSVPLGEDLPWSTPEIQRSDLALFRTYDSPTKYAVGGGSSVFGRGMVGVEVERLCSTFRVFGVDQW